MAPFDRIWDNTQPPDTQAANQLGLDIRNLKTDISQRASAMSGREDARPSFESSFNGVLYFTTDTSKVFQWNGASWVDVTNLVTGANALGYVPVQTGTGVGQLAVVKDSSGNPITNLVKLGTSGLDVITGKPILKATVDAVDVGILITSLNMAGLLAASGYQYIGSLLLQWAVGPVDAAGSAEPSYNIPWQLRFPNQCLVAYVSTNLATPSGSAGNWYQTVNWTQDFVTVQKQRASGSSTSIDTKAIVFGIGH